MNLFGLIIQRTTSGLNDMFVSDELKEKRKTPEIEQSTDDENKYATKLANHSNVYTIQITVNYKVYSLIITDVTDSFGRSGFYAIRLYVPKKYLLVNFEENLRKINEKYLEYEKNGTPKNSQDYNAFLNYNLPLEVKQQDFITAKTDEQAFCLFDANNPQLNSVFNNKAIGLFNKVYAFDKENAVQTDVIKSLGLKSYEETKHSINEVSIINNHQILKEIKVNSNPIAFNPNEKELTLITKVNDVIEYNTTDNPKFKQSAERVIFVQRKDTTPPRSQGHTGRKKPGFFEEYGIYILIGVMTLVLGFLCWYLFIKDDTKPVQGDNPEMNNPVTNITEKDSSLITSFAFINDGSPLDSVYKTNYHKLEKYRFRLENKKWSYKNIDENKYADFYISNLDEIIKNESLDINESKKLDFLNKLKEISGGHAVSIKEVQQNNSGEAKKSVEVIKKESKNSTKPKENKQSPASKKAKPKDDMKVDGDSKI